jgi:hypothetical protein
MEKGVRGVKRGAEKRRTQRHRGHGEYREDNE